MKKREKNVLVKSLLVVVLLLPFVSCSSHERKDIVFEFKEKDSVFYKEGNEYYLKGLYFRENKNNIKPKGIGLKKAYQKAISVEQFKKEEAKKMKKMGPFYDSNYRYFLITTKKEGAKSLIPIVRLIVVEDNEIID